MQQMIWTIQGNNFYKRNEERGRSLNKFEDAELQKILDEDDILNQ